jgi:hypothetical protein
MLHGASFMACSILVSRASIQINKKHRPKYAAKKSINITQPPLVESVGPVLLECVSGIFGNLLIAIMLGPSCGVDPTRRLALYRITSPCVASFLWALGERPSFNVIFRSKEHQMISSLVGLLITILILGLICGIVWWIINMIPMPEPFKQIVRVIFAVIMLIIVIYLLVGLMPSGGTFHLFNR